MHSEVSVGPGMQSGIQSCISHSLSNIYLDRSLAVFSLFFLSDICNYMRIIMNIIVLYQHKVKIGTKLYLFTYLIWTFSE